MLNYPPPGRPVEVQATMGSDNAKKVHQHGGGLTGNQYKVLTHMAWVSYDRRGIPKDGKDRDGNPAQALRFFGNAQAAALEALGRDKKPAVALRLWERAVKELVEMGILKVIQRAIPNKQTALHEISVERLELLSKSVDNPEGTPEASEQKVRQVDVQKVRQPSKPDVRKVRQTPEASEQKVHAYLQASTFKKNSSSNNPLTSVPALTVVSPTHTAPPDADEESSIYDQARHYLGNLGPDRWERYMEEARQTLGPDAPLRDRVIHAANQAGHQHKAAS